MAGRAYPGLQQQLFRSQDAAREIPHGESAVIKLAVDDHKHMLWHLFMSENAYQMKEQISASLS